ncbi:MAG TPA: glycosyltransferase family 4 protein [Gemmatimonadales bacterium]
MADTPRKEAAVTGKRIGMMIGSDTLGGAEMVMLDLAVEMRQRGHSVLPIGPAGHDGWMRTGWLSRRFAEEGFAWHTYEQRRAIDPLCVRDMVRLFRSLNVDLVHSHEYAAAVYGAAAARVAGVPHVITMHGDQHVTKRLRRRMALRWAFGGARATIAVSSDTRDYLERDLGLPSDSVRVITNGVPVRGGDPEPIRRELGLADGEILIVAIGSLIKRKGHEILLEALAAHCTGEGIPRWRVAIAGKGEEREALETWAREHEIGSRVHILGPRDDIGNLLAAAAIFAMPSLWEGLPLALLEAMFAEKAIVASAVSGIPEAAHDGEHALLTPAGDGDAVGRAIRRLLQEPRTRVRLGTAAGERARTAFSVRAMADAYETAYWVEGRP